MRSRWWYLFVFCFLASILYVGSPVTAQQVSSSSQRQSVRDTVTVRYQDLPNVGKGKQDSVRYLRYKDLPIAGKEKQKGVRCLRYQDLPSAGKGKQDSVRYLRYQDLPTVEKAKRPDKK
jgi:hypothetical protein